jgi:hypothetical protein
MSTVEDEKAIRNDRKEGSNMFGSESVAGANDSQMSAKTQGFGEVVRDIRMLTDETRLQSVAEMIRTNRTDFMYTPWFAAGAGVLGGVIIGLVALLLL